MTETFTPSTKKTFSETQVLLIVLAIFFVGLCLRLIGLSSIPFSSDEAQSAWQAFNVAHNLPDETAANATYQGLTALTFKLMQANAFWSRFGPVLAGASLALIPLFWRKKTNTFITIGLSLAFALDPVLYVLSRQAGSPIFILAGLAWAITFFFIGQPIGVGVALALAILGSPWFWAVLLIMLVAIALAYLINKKALKEVATSLLNVCPIRRSPTKFVLSFVVTLLALATSFGMDPAGLSGIAGGLVAFLQQGFSARVLPIWVPAYRWAAYSLGPAILALFAAIQAWKEDLVAQKVISLLGIIFFAGALLFANLGAAGLAFVQISVWILAIHAIEHILSLKTEQPRATLLVFGLSLVICVYLALSLKAMLNLAPGTLAFTQQGLALLLGLVLLVLVYLLTGLGWSFPSAAKGTVSTLVVVLLVTTLSLTFSSMSIKAENAALIWSDSPLLNSADEIRKVLHEAERLNTFEAETAQVVLLDKNLSGYSWNFRNFGRVETLMALPEGVAPEVILSGTEWKANPEQPYRGMTIIASKQAAWEAMGVYDLAKCLLTQEPATQQIEAIFWIRQDLFTGTNQ